MDARFELIDRDGKVLNEFALARAGAEWAELVDNLKPLYGVLVLTLDDDMEITITDDFDIMMEQVCLRSAEQLGRGISITYSLAAHPETIRFDVEDDRVRICGDVSETVLCDRIDLVEALLECGERFVAFKSAQLGSEPSARYREELETARSSWAAHSQ